MLWLFDSDRLQTDYLRKAVTSLVTLEKYDEHSEWSGQFPASAYEALEATPFVQAQGEDELYLVESLTLHESKGYVIAGGRSASALLEDRQYVRGKAVNVKAGEAIRQLLLTLGMANQVPAMTADNAPTGVVSASSTLGTWYEAFRAFDGHTTTVWHSGATGPPFWLRYDCGTGKTARHYAITNRFDNGGTHHPKAWVLQGSNNLSTWTDLDSRSAQTFSPGERKLLPIASPASYRYYQIVVTLTSDDGLCCVISDLELLDTDTSRAIPGLVFGTGATLGELTSIPADIESMGKLLLDVLQSAGLGFKCTLSGTDIVLDVIAPTAVDTLVGEKYRNAKSGTVESMLKDWKNFAYVQGENADGTPRIVTVDWTGADPRRELSVRASINRTPDGTNAIPDAEYDAMLAAYGAGALANHRRLLSASAETIAVLSPGDVVWYDSGRFSAQIMATEIETVRERGIKRTVRLGAAPSTDMRQIIRRVTGA